MIDSEMRFNTWQSKIRLAATWLALVLTVPVFGQNSDSFSSLSVGTVSSLDVETTNSGLRHYLAYLPQNAPDRKAPLVIILHGLAGSGEQFLAQTHWKDAADRHGFILLAPDGQLPIPTLPANIGRNVRLWNAGPLTSEWVAAHAKDDSGFLRQLITDWINSGRAAPGQIYVTGFSNGAAMAFRAGADLSDLVSAIAPVSNPLLMPVESLHRPVSLLMIWGEADPVSPFAGGSLERGGREINRPSAHDSFEVWSRLLGCEGDESQESPAPTVTLLVHPTCHEKSETELYSVAGMGHQWPGGNPILSGLAGPMSDRLDATEVIWQFFIRHKRL